MIPIWPWLGLLSWAGALQLEVDRRELQVGESLSLYLTFVDVNPGVPPRLPRVEGLSFDYQGMKFASVRVNGQAQDTVTFLYSMTALSPGRHTLPALELNVGGEVLRSPALTVEVQPRAPLGAGTRITAALQGAEGPVSEAWVGQTLVYTMAFATQERLLDRRWTPPVFEGLLAEQTLDAQVHEYDSRLDGATWGHIRLEQPLVVTAPGRRSLPPGVLAVQLPDPNSRTTRGLRVLSGVRNEVFSTEPLELAARPLPAEGRAPDFSGLVGQFELTAELLDEEVALGESATLQVTLRGDGTLSGFRLPPLPADTPLTAYDDSPTLRSEVREGRFFTEATFRRALVPEAEGVVEVPPIRLQVFDPALGQYVERSGPALTLRVSPGQADPGLSRFGEAEGDGRTAVRDQGDDVLPVHTPVSRRAALLEPWALGPWLVGGLPWLGFAGVGAAQALRGRRPRTDPRRALVARLPGLAAAGLPELEAALHEALGLALGRPPGALDAEALSALPEALRAPARALYLDLQAARYGGAAPAGLGDRVQALVRALLEVRP